jgi:rSAM/selenodomain-associated transferase 1
MNPHRSPVTRLLVFAKAPQAGAVKTRLIPALGAQGAADLAWHLLQHTLAQALAAKLGPIELCMSPGPSDPAWAHVPLPDTLVCSTQGSGDLGERMARALQRSTAHGQAVLLLGTDCPALTAPLLQQLAQALTRHDSVLVPVADGGYSLIGLKTPCPALFKAMPWSTAEVAQQTRQRLAAAGLSLWESPVLHDLDEPADLVHLPPELAARFKPQ